MSSALGFGSDEKNALGTFLKRLFNTFDDAFVNSTLSKGSFSTTTSYWNPQKLQMAMEIVSNTLSVFSTSIADYDESKIDAVEKAVGFIGTLAGVIDDPKFNQSALSKVFTGDVTLSNIGKQIKMFGYYMKYFYDYIADMKGFKEDEAAETTRKVESISYLVKQMAIAMQDMIYFGSSAELINSLGESLPKFGDSIAAFFTRLDTSLPKDITVERSEMILNAVNSMAALIESLTDMSHLLSTFSTQSISDVVNKIFDGFTEQVSNNEDIVVKPGVTEKLAKGILAIDTALARVMSDPNLTSGYEEIGKNLASKISEGIENAMFEDESLRPRIVPVLDLEPMKQQMREAFGTDMSGPVNWEALASAVYGANSDTDTNKVDPNTLYTHIDSVGTEIVNMKNSQASIADVTNAFTGIQIVTDTDALVGAIIDRIDDVLGERIWNIIRNVTPG